MKLNHECLRDGEPNNVIFLDMDGVVNSLRSLKFMEMVDMECARHVKRISQFANADIVLSSTWRIGNNTHTIREMLYPIGLYRVIGRTCSNGVNMHRGDEINAWIEEFGCKNYVILDDDTDFTDYQKQNHFIQTDPVTGITEQDSTRAIREIFKVKGLFCPECNGYGRIGEWDKCPSCK
ncbi:hypothetical protein JC221_176 [Yersinia phage JC221]|nr:hypothetical protein JC221_176 [Yersinia phage JC221]